MGSIWQDVRYAARVFRGHPGAFAISVLSLAIAVGASSTLFSLVDGMFLRPLPVRDPGSLVRLQWQSVDGQTSAMAWTDLQLLKESGGAFEDIAAQNRRGAQLDIGGDTELTLLTIVSDNYFPLLGVSAARGRLFRADLDKSLENEPAVAVTDGLWRRRFGADPGLVGRTIRLNNRTFTVVGILPPSFTGLLRGVVTDLWVPATTWRAMGGAREFEDRVAGQFEPIGRLKPGASIEAAQAQLDLFSRRLQEELPDATRGRRLVVRTQADYEDSGRSRVVTLLFLAISGLLIVIACVNVAQLLMALAEARRREIAIRQSLGASRTRLVRQLLTESVLLAVAGALAALLLASWLIPLLPVLFPPGLSFLRFDIRFDARVVVATFLTCLVTILVFGLVPALLGSRADLTDVIKSSGSDARRRFGGRKVLVVSQAMLCVTLLSSAGLLALSFVRAQQIKPGFDTGRQSLLMTAAMNGSRNSLPATCDQIAERVGGMRGVKRVAYCRRFPLSGSGGGATRGITIPGRQAPPDQQLLRIRFNQISPDYLAVTGTKLVAGRAFSRSDANGTLPVVMISETMARQLWPAGNAIGSWIRDDSTDRQVVGIVEDTAVNAFREDPQPFLYFPFAQLPASEMTFVVEAAADPTALPAAIKQEIRTAAPGSAVMTVNTLKQHVRGGLYQDWLQAVLSITVAAIGMVLAIAGLIGVVNHSVARRRREFGIRAALGARRAEVVAMVLKQGLGLNALGGLLGIGLSLAAGRAMSGLLYGVSPADPFVIGSSVILVLIAGLVGSAYPARKATRVNPVDVLRAE